MSIRLCDLRDFCRADQGIALYNYDNDEKLLYGQMREATRGKYRECEVVSFEAVAAWPWLYVYIDTENAE